MTSGNNLEQKFYHLFDIKPKKFDENYFFNSIEIDGKRYSIIDDRKLLEMICIINKSELNMPIDGITVQEIKENLLHKFINMSVYFKREIQQLFKEDINNERL